jgi:hypothetical protein
MITRKILKLKSGRVVFIGNKLAFNCILNNLQHLNNYKTVLQFHVSFQRNVYASVSREPPHGGKQNCYELLIMLQNTKQHIVNTIT